MLRILVVLSLSLFIINITYAQTNFWEEVNNGLYGGSNTSVPALAINDSGHVFAGTGSGVFRSIDNGNDWAEINNGLQKRVVRSLAINDSDHVFAAIALSGGIYRSTDNGDSWAQVLADHSVTDLAVYDSRVFAGTFHGDLFRSTDNGDNWSKINNEFTGVLAIDNNSGHVFVVATDGLLRSTDNGDNWTLLNKFSLRGAHVLAINDSGHIFAGVYARIDVEGVYGSTDNGDNWTEFNNGLTTPVFSWTTVWSFAFNDAGQLFTGVLGGGVFRTVASTTVSVGSFTDIAPNNFALLQNYPNPFNPSTIISYSIFKPGFVTLTIYNILGRETKTLVSEFQIANTYSVNFDASKLSSGIYFYRLQVGHEFVGTKKMLLMR